MKLIYAGQWINKNISNIAIQKVSIRIESFLDELARII